MKFFAFIFGFLAIILIVLQNTEAGATTIPNNKEDCYKIKTTDFPVCGDDGKTYGNGWHIICENIGRETPIRQAHVGRCEDSIN